MIAGVLVVDKPRGPTSFEVVAEVRRRFGEKRVGHAGTLDPMATGILPVCLGEATKLVPFLMAGDKSYQAEALLGRSTDTLDAEGKVTGERDASHLVRADVESALGRFSGKILQRPPMHSAIRVAGRRLYELARQGQEIEREAREVEIFAITLDAFEPGQAARVRFSVRCGKGTYIRSLAADLGEALKVGAHLTALRRTRVGPFSLDRAVALSALGELGPAGEPALMGLADALAGLPTLTLSEAEARDVRDGKLKTIEALAAPPGERVRLLRPDGTLAAVCARPGGKLRLERVFG